MVRGAATLALLAGIVAGCGTVGPPVPPEFVGIGAKLQKEKEKAKEEEKRKELERQQDATKAPAPERAAGAPENGETEEPKDEASEEEDVTLPPLRPIGTPR